MSSPGAASEPATIALWAGARERGSTGVEAVQGHMLRSAWEVPWLGDGADALPPEARDRDHAAQVRHLLGYQHALLAGFHVLGPAFGLSLRVIRQRGGTGPPRVRLFLVTRAFAATPREAEHLDAQVRAVLARNAVPGVPLVEVGVTMVDALFAALQGVAEILKPERFVPTAHEPDLFGLRFHYDPGRFAPSEHDGVGLIEILFREPARGTLALDLVAVPAVPLTAAERLDLEGRRAHYRRWSSTQHIRETIPGGLYTRPSSRLRVIAPEPEAAAMEKRLGQILEQYGDLGRRVFLYGCRVLCEPMEPPVALAASLAASCQRSGHRLAVVGVQDPEVHRRILNALHGVYVTPSVCDRRWRESDAPETIRRIHRLADVEELSSLMRIPIPDAEGCPGMPIAHAPERKIDERCSLSTFRLGAVLSTAGALQHEISTPVAARLLLVGLAEAGRADLARSLLAQAWRIGRAPFVCVDAGLGHRLVHRLEGLAPSLQLFTAGREDLVPLRLNPLDIPSRRTRVAEGIAACLRIACPLPHIASTAIEESILQLWRAWDDELGRGAQPTEAPRLEALAARLWASPSDADSGPLASLLSGPGAGCFGARRAVPIGQFLGRPTVLDLGALGSEARAFALGLLVSRLAEEVRSTGAVRGSVLLLEEVDGLFASPPGDPPDRLAARRRLAVDLQTLEDAGWILLLTARQGGALLPELTARTITTVLFRSEPSEDIQGITRFTSLPWSVVEQLPRMPRGTAILKEPAHGPVRIATTGLQAEVSAPLAMPSDEEVRAAMDPLLRSPAFRAIHLPYSGCDDRCEQCDPTLRRTAEDFARAMRRRVEASAREPSGESVRASTSRLFSEEWPESRQALGTHCAKIHLREHVVRPLEQARRE